MVHRTEEHLTAVELGHCHRRLNQLAKRMARARYGPTQADIAEATALKERIAELKRGQRFENNEPTGAET